MHLTRAHLFRITKYLVSGSISAVVNIGSLFILVQVFGVYYLAGSVVAFFFGVVISFVLQKFWTFEDSATEGIYRQFAFFLMVVLPNLALNTLLVYVLVDRFAVWYLLAQIATGIVITVTGYLSYHFFVFTPAPIK